jgi:hypothetical protein
VVGIWLPLQLLSGGPSYWDWAGEVALGWQVKKGKGRNTDKVRGVEAPGDHVGSVESKVTPMGCRRLLGK